MLRLKGLGTQILRGAATRRLQPLCTPFSSSHWYSTAWKASSNDELSETPPGLSSSLGHFAPTQPDFLQQFHAPVVGCARFFNNLIALGFLRTCHIFLQWIERCSCAHGQTNKIYVKHTVFKDEGALGMRPKLPEYITLNMGGVTLAKEGCMFLEFTPAVGPRQYDWSKRKVIALSVVEVGNLLSLGPHESCEFTHDTFLGKSEAGKVWKVLKVGNLQDTEGYFFNFSVTDRIANADLRLSIPITTGEFSVIQSSLNFILPYLMGWHAYTDSTKSNESGHCMSGRPVIAKRPDLEWGR